MNGADPRLLANGMGVLASNAAPRPGAYYTDEDIESSYPAILVFSGRRDALGVYREESVDNKLILSLPTITMC